MRAILTQGRDMKRGIRYHGIEIGITGHGIGIRELGIAISSKSQYFNLRSKNNFGFIVQNIEIVGSEINILG